MGRDAAFSLNFFLEAASACWSRDPWFLGWLVSGVASGVGSWGLSDSGEGGGESEKYSSACSASRLVEELCAERA